MNNHQQLHLFVLVTLLTHCCTARPQFFSFIPYVTSVETAPPQPAHALAYSQVPQNIAAVSPQFYQAVTPPPPKQGPVRLLFLSFTRFPWPVESFVQRLQNYFSTYTVTQEPLLIEEVDLGPDLVPVDELEPEQQQNGSGPPSSPGVLTIELPNPAWSTSQFNLGPNSNDTAALTSNEIDQQTASNENQTMMQEEMPNPSWPSTSDVTPTMTFQETTTRSVDSNTLRNIKRL